MEKVAQEETQLWTSPCEFRIYFTVKDFFTDHFILTDFWFVINETPNLKLYRNRDFAFQKELLWVTQHTSPAETWHELQGENVSALRSGKSSWHILLRQGTINCCCPSEGREPLTNHAHWGADSANAERPHSSVLACALPPSKPCGTYSTVLWLENSFLTLLAVERVKC